MVSGCMIVLGLNTYYTSTSADLEDSGICIGNSAKGCMKSGLNCQIWQ